MSPSVEAEDVAKHLAEALVDAGWVSPGNHCNCCERLGVDEEEPVNVDELTEVLRKAFIAASE